MASVTDVAFEKFNPWSWLRRMSDAGVAVLVVSGAPTSGTSGTAVNRAGIGTLLIDTTNGNLYINTGTKASPTWSLLTTGAGGSTFLDSAFTIQDNIDTTKQMRFQASGITTATTRTYTVPDVSDTLVTLGASQTLTSKTLTSPTLTTPAIGVATGTSLAATGAITSSGGGVGYAVGAGGTIAQGSGSGKATTVVLNKLSGAITMDGATLNAGVIVSFTLTNSFIAITDVLVLNHISGGTVGSYTLNAQAGSGSATINVRNATAGNLTESPVLQFAVIKAVNT